MPHHPEDRHYPHLRAERASEPFLKRQPGGGGRGRAPDRGGRETFGPRFERTIAALEASVAPRSPAGDAYNPHLVFRVPTAKSTPLNELTEALADAGIAIVSVDADGTIIAFKDDAKLDAFRAMAQAYQQLQPDRRTGETRRTTDQDILEWIELDQMRALTSKDRMTPRLVQQFGEELERIREDAMYVVDVELWATGQREESERSIAELAAVLAATNNAENRIVDRFVGKILCLAKLKLTGTALRTVLNLPVVAEADLPPEPAHVAMSAHHAIAQDIAPPDSIDEEGAKLCIIDSGVASGHPLLKPYVVDERAILTADVSPGDRDGHGTRVAGIALYGDVAGALASRNFYSDIRIYSARILNSEGRFDDEKLLVNQILAAIEAYSEAPHNCNVFNLSIGSDGPSLMYHTLRQTQWAEVLDIAAAQSNLLFVVSAGNNYEVLVRGTRQSEDAIARYPENLERPEARLNDPATAAIALTVGSLAHSVRVVSTGDGEDITRPVVGVDQPSPFTRAGPGYEDMIKPDLVDYGGNLVLGRFGGGPGLDTNDGTSILTLNRVWTEGAFTTDIGSSLAAPRVSRLAAQLWDDLQDQIDEPVQANLVRAVLANTATVPDSAVEKLGGKSPQDPKVLNACGYGRVDDGVALRSGDRTVTLIAQHQVPLNHFEVYRVPVPPEFIATGGPKRISVTLAFDPPVRRRRQEYLGVTMQFDMLRGMTSDEVFEAYRRLEPEEDLPPITDARRLPFLPGINHRKRGTLQKGVLEFEKKPKYNSEDYWLVVRAARRWAPPDITHQRYALAITLQADEPRLYNLVRSRLTAEVRARIEL